MISRAQRAYSLSDRALAQRLERAEGSGNAAFVEARARGTPESGARWREVSGTYAMFDGVGSPISQTFGLGLFAPATAEDLDTIEAFFHERGAEVHHEVSPLADPALLALLPARDYHPMELTSVMHQPLPLVAGRGRASEVRARRIEPGEETLWAETTARGWSSESPELADFVRGFGLVTVRARGAVCFVAELAGTVIAAGAVTIHDGVALLAGASTVPEWRRRGAQAALLAARLQHAAEQGCDLAMMAAQPGSTSQLNGERQGFRIAYTRMKWRQARG